MRRLHVHRRLRYYRHFVNRKLAEAQASRDRAITASNQDLEKRRDAELQIAEMEREREGLRDTLELVSTDGIKMLGELAEAKARIMDLEAENGRLRIAALAVQDYLIGLQATTDMGDPLYGIRRRIHAPLLEKLKDALNPPKEKTTPRVTP